MNVATEPDFFADVDVKTALQEVLIRVLLEPLPCQDGTVINCNEPNIVDDNFREERKQCTGDVYK